MMPPEIEETLERAMRTVNDLGHFDAAQRPVVEVILHQALVDMHVKINTARLADCQDIDTLSAALDASIARNASLSAELGQAQVQMGAYESAAEDMRNDRYERDQIIANLQDNVTRLMAELAAARQPTAAKPWTAGESAGDQIRSLLSEVDDLRLQLATATAQTTVVAPPHVNGTAATTRLANGKRKLDRDELLTMTVDHIKSLAKELGRTPTLNDFNETHERAGLPVWNSLTDRLGRSWMSLVLAADLTPNKPGPRPEAKSAKSDDDED